MVQSADLSALNDVSTKRLNNLWLILPDPTRINPVFLPSDKTLLFGKSGLLLSSMTIGLLKESPHVIVCVVWQLSPHEI